MLIRETDTEAEVALGVGAFYLHRHILLLVPSQIDICVEKTCIVGRAGGFQLYVDKLHHGEAPESLVGSLHLARRVKLSGHNIAHLVEHLRPEIAVFAVEDCDAAVAHGIAKSVARAVVDVVIHHISHIAHHIAAEFPGSEAESEVYTSAPGHSIGVENNIVACKVVVPGIAQQTGHAGALVVEHIAVEQNAGAQERCPRMCGYDAPQSGVGHIVADRRYHMRLTGIDMINYPHALSAREGIGRDCSVRKATVHHCKTELHHGGVGKLVVVEHGGLSHPAQHAVVPACAIGPREAIGGQLQAREAKHLVVRHLPEKVVQLFLLHVVAVVHHNVDLIQQIASFGYMPGGTAPAHHEGTEHPCQPIPQLSSYHRAVSRGLQVWRTRNGRRAYNLCQARQSLREAVRGVCIYTARDRSPMHSGRAW